MTSVFQCPICQQPLKPYLTTRDLHCGQHHKFAYNEAGYWVFAKSKKEKGTSLSRAQMRSRMFLLASGMLTPIVTQIKPLVTAHFSKDHTYQWLDYECGDGFYLGAIVDSLKDSGLTLQPHGFSEAENALFVAAKNLSDISLCQSSTKRLPYADEAFDLLTLIDKPLKGKEFLRVLKQDGIALMVVVGPRHLWQIREQLYPNLVAKEFSLDLPASLTVLASEAIQWQADVSGEQALTLLDMTPYAWRANDKQRQAIAHQAISGLEFDYRLVIAKKVSA
ncbi:SAM-dependent methyltransferase [Shewanella sp. NIFS-20-20]|uniref:SAM-dependent methyltransferase n=1 Tax=Shewanella sp. NIFS-20-20 TaxID=2853806 RepID=UPI001C45091A|nr:SAM-dependent methyltransferase [Shewanella sp. NIFS-20-20]MBV7314277.1 SAM-dependent methyltransferase [Shewanella sp. NIFS-20-20]